MSELELRDKINKALVGTYVQTVTVEGLTVTLITMETMKATALNSKVGSFLHLIPGTVSVHLDRPVMHLLLHGIPTSCSIETIATNLTTFNSGLALAGTPRWLTTEQSRIGKLASTVVIAVRHQILSVNAWRPFPQHIGSTVDCRPTPTPSAPTVKPLVTTATSAPVQPCADGPHPPT